MSILCSIPIKTATYVDFEGDKETIDFTKNHLNWFKSNHPDKFKNDSEEEKKERKESNIIYNTIDRDDLIDFADCIYGWSGDMHGDQEEYMGHIISGITGHDYAFSVLMPLTLKKLLPVFKGIMSENTYAKLEKHDFEKNYLILL